MTIITELLSHLNYAYIFAGLAVGFIVGMTGIGGGSLMTPILLQFGIPPVNAVGTDLIYAAVTKANGVFVHQIRGNIDWGITLRLAAGSLPAAIVTLAILSFYMDESRLEAANEIICWALGFALLLTALAILFKQSLLNWSHRNDVFLTRMNDKQRKVATVVVGVLLGVVVTITSIGAGALGTMALFLVYPALATSKLVGSEIAHAVPLTLIAGLGHASVGNVDYPLLANLLIGSLPGIWFGSHLTGKVSDRFLRPALSFILIYAGSKLLLA